MSQSGLLNEDEIKSYINEAFNLKLDREAFIKPTRNVVFDIYTRFLDETHHKWRKLRNSADDSEEPNIKAMTVGWIRFMLARYNTSFTFQMSDLLTPTRKRTTTFFNILIYIRAQFEDSWAEWQEWKSEWSINQEEIEKVNRELAQKRLDLEELAIKKANSRPISELQKEIREKRRLFEAASKECEDLEEESKVVKSNIQKLTALIQSKEDSGELLDKEIAQAEKKLQLLNDGRNVKKRSAELEQAIQEESYQLKVTNDECQNVAKRIVDLERLLGVCQLNNDELAKEIDYTHRLFMKLKEEKDAIEHGFSAATIAQTKWQAEETLLQEQLANLERNKTKIRLQFKIKEDQLRLDLERRIAYRKEMAQELALKIDQLKMEVENIKRERAEILAKQTASTELCKAHAEKVDRQLEVLVKRCEESQRITQGDIAHIIDCQRQIDSIMGSPKEIELPANNRTYIKESSGDRP